ncbi:hypothetical protein C8Q75DRAFT_802393 [Abortiporus biennis]|nr:hypothetical protein C8Q75DRAFT_802393 [Abortiporus biennis]
MSSNTQSARRNLGWRKPVPTFIPSPSRPSSLLSDAAAFKPFSPLHLSRKLPPLPPDWKETIEKALTQEQVSEGTEQYPVVATNDLTAPTEDSGNSSPRRKHSAVHALKDTEVNDFHSSRQHNNHRRISKQRSMHRIYRPPTPPAPTVRGRSHSECTYAQSHLSFGSSQTMVTWDTQAQTTFPVYLHHADAASMAATATDSGEDVPDMHRFAALSHRRRKGSGYAVEKTSSMDSVDMQWCCDHVRTWSRLKHWGSSMRGRMSRLFQSRNIVSESMKY